jgi:hypothetical protein
VLKGLLLSCSTARGDDERIVVIRRLDDIIPGG